VKVSKDANSFKRGERKGRRPGEFDAPHSLAMVQTGGSRRRPLEQPHPKFSTRTENSSRSGRQSGRPSGVFIDKKDIILRGRLDIQ